VFGPNWLHRITAGRHSGALDLPHDSAEAAFVVYIYSEFTTGQAALYQLGLMDIPITKVNSNCTTGSTVSLWVTTLLSVPTKFGVTPGGKGPARGVVKPIVEAS
jgi:hypothetical protein